MENVSLLLPRPLPSSSSSSSPSSPPSSSSSNLFPLCKSQLPICRNSHEPFPHLSYLRSFRGRRRWWRRRKLWTTHLKASMRESPYDVLGVSPSATPKDIKRVYRKLALKYHPDVNKEPNAEEKFMRIKHAYNTLINPKQRSDYSSSTTERNRSWKAQEEEEFYGLGNFLREVQITIGDFFRDLQVEFQNWEASANSQEKPKSLWEELADIGEEFVEFLEKELNIADMNIEDDDGTAPNSYGKSETKKAGDSTKKEAKASSIEDNIEEIEAALQQLKKELGL